MDNWDDIVERVARELYEKRQTGLIDAEMVTQTANHLMQAITIGYGKGFDDADTDKQFDTLMSLRENVFHFSGAKNYNQLQEMSALLTSGDNIRSFEDFLIDVQKIDKTYNALYLEAEYNNAINSSRMIAQWQQIESESEALPFLQYHAVMDGRTRESHAIMNGITRKFNDTFWKTYYPPNGWNCRCSVRQLDEDDADGKQHEPLPQNLPTIPTYFKTNVGQTGVAFSDKHPYFTSIPKKMKPKVAAASDQLMRANTKSASKTTPVIKDKNVLRAVDKKTGAELWVSQKADKKDRAYNVKQAKVFLKNGINVTIREHSNESGVKNPELEIDGKIGDFKTPESNSHSSLQKQIQRAGKQKAQFAAIVIDASKFTEDDFRRALNAGFQKGFNSSVEFVYLLSGNKIVKIERAEVEGFRFMDKIRNFKGNQ